MELYFNFVFNGTIIWVCSNPRPTCFIFSPRTLLSENINPSLVTKRRKHEPSWWMAEDPHLVTNFLLKLKKIYIETIELGSWLLTFNLFLDNLGRVEPVRDIVGIGVLEAKVILLNDVQVIVHLLHQLLSNRFFLQKYTLTCLSRNKTQKVVLANKWLHRFFIQL